MSQRDPVRTEAEGGVAVIWVANPPVNALSAGVRGGLLRALEAAGSDGSVRAVVLAAEGRAFIAGADISEFGKPPVPPSLPEVVAA
uniref:enoyl-CoA hydratase/isomerase family protein n=1 Tax=Roseomonas chloroacetimidivorans TaxID=1766656 RepID=UPI003C718E0C